MAAREACALLHEVHAFQPKGSHWVGALHNHLQAYRSSSHQLYITLWETFIFHTPRLPKLLNPTTLIASPLIH